MAVDKKWASPSATSAPPKTMDPSIVYTGLFRLYNELTDSRDRPRFNFHQIIFKPNCICREGVTVVVMAPAPGMGTPLPSKIWLKSSGGEKLG